MSLREDIRAFAQQAKCPVLMVPTPELPQWDGQIGVTRTTPRMLSKHWKDNDDEDMALDGRVLFVILVACDKDGNQIFDDGDVHWLGTSRVLMPMIERLYYAGLEHNGLTEKNRKDWRKNSEPTAGDGSPSSSAVPSIPATDSTSTAS
jgi:hypothetical protein